MKNPKNPAKKEAQEKNIVSMLQQAEKIAEELRLRLEKLYLAALKMQH